MHQPAALHSDSTNTTHRNRTESHGGGKEETKVQDADKIGKKDSERGRESEAMSDTGDGRAVEQSTSEQSDLTKRSGTENQQNNSKAEARDEQRALTTPIDTQRHEQEAATGSHSNG